MFSLVHVFADGNPMYLIQHTVSSAWLWSLYWCSSNFSLQVTGNTASWGVGGESGKGGWRGENNISSSHPFPHSASWSNIALLKDLVIRESHDVVCSCVNNKEPNPCHLGVRRSIVYTKNKQGPRTLPCGQWYTEQLKHSKCTLVQFIKKIVWRQ